MNDQSKPQEQTSSPPSLVAGANARLMGRRRLAKIALGTPVLMTLASRPVLAGQCLSNMMSGNLSNPDRGNCSKGWSPGGWGQPGGNVYKYTTAGAWQAINLVYGTFSPDSCPEVTNPKETKYQCYAGGSTITTLVGLGAGSLNKGGLPITTTLVDVLCDPTLDNLTRLLICAYMNALLSAANVGFTYILTTQQVLDLANGVIPVPPGYPSLSSFLSSTWT